MAGLILALFADAALGRGVFFERDIHMMWYGQVEAFVHAVASGSWPVWDPYPAFGRPLWANPNNQVLYPPTWLNLVMRPWTYYAWFVVGHFLLSAAGTLLLARRLGVSTIGALVAAAVWTTSGPLVSLVRLWNHLAAAAWLPWAFLAADTAATSGGRRHAVAWGAALAAPILAGSPEVFAMAVLGSVLWAAARQLRRQRLTPVVLARLASSVALASGFALALTAGQWLPTLEVVRQSARWHLPPEVQTAWSVHPLSLFEMVLPFSWAGLPLRPDWLASILDLREPWLRSVYLGIPVLALAAGGWATGRAGSRFFCLLGLAAAVVALGRHLPAHEVVLTALRPFAALRFPAKAIILAGLCWSLASGLGYDAWRRTPQRRQWILGVAAPLLALFALSSAAAAAAFFGAERWGPLLLARRSGGPSLSQMLAPTAHRLLVASGLAATGLGLAVVRLRRAGRLSWCAGTLAAFCIVDLLSAHYRLNALAPRELYGLRPELLEALHPSPHRRVYVQDLLVAIPGRPRALSPLMLQRAPAGWSRVAALHLGVQMYLNPPTAGRWGIRGSYDPDLLELYPRPLSRLTDLVRAMEDPAKHLRLLRLGSVDEVVALDPGAWSSSLLPVATLPGLFRQPIRVFRVPDPLPRTYVVGGVRVADGEKAIEVLLDPAFDPWRELVLPEGSAVQADPSFSGESHLLELRPDRVRIEAVLNRPGYVVLVDGYDPGWRVRVDGQPAELLRANLVFRAVPIPAGRHLVEQVYRPRSITLGLMVSATALLAGLAALVRGHRPPAPRSLSE